MRQIADNFTQNHIERKAAVRCSYYYLTSNERLPQDIHAKVTRLLLKPVSHQPCGSRAPVRVDKFLDFVRQPHGVVYYTARLSYEKQGRKAAATNFRHVHFLCDLLAFSERCTTAARHTRLSQDCCKTRKVFVRLTL